MSLQSSERGKMEDPIQRITGQSASPPSREDDGATHFRGHYQASEGKEGYQEKSA